MRLSGGAATMNEFGPSSRVYVDTNVWIYYIESNPKFVETVEAIFRRIDDGGGTLVTNEIAIAECLMKPSKDEDRALMALYDAGFSSDPIEIASFAGGIARRAAEGAGKLGLKLIDAIHYTSALESNCQYFLTADTQFKSGQTMDVIRIS